MPNYRITHIARATKVARSRRPEGQKICKVKKGYKVKEGHCSKGRKDRKVTRSKTADVRQPETLGAVHLKPPTNISMCGTGKKQSARD